MNRTARWIIAIVLFQAGLTGLYLLVESQRSPKALLALGTDPPLRIDTPMPSLTVVHRDGNRADLPSPGRRTLVHIWATWCPPCRAELPGLLALHSQPGLDVVAIALDQNWNDIRRFVGDTGLSNVVLAESQGVQQALNLRTLPVTFLVESNGRIALRFDGARDWANRDFVRTYVEGQVDGR